MIEQTAMVIDTHDDIAYVKVQRESTCGQCSLNKGCGTNVFSKVLGNKFSQLRVLNPVKAEKGDVVVLGIHESVLIKSALIMYLFPLVMMFGGAAFMQLLDNWLPGIKIGQTGIIVSSFICLLLAFIYIRKSSKRHIHNQRYQPFILKKATLTDMKASPFHVETN
ncbi:MAG: SoxR reducing system RseC family protein [Thioalkalispiraceae bacterium]|jgi:sigma-E factor negative regulatory protein RseC